jgi:DNA-binding PadR family transcriptional regulator
VFVDCGEGLVTEKKQGHPRKHRRGRRRDFWHDWQEERHRLWEAHEGPGGQPGLHRPPFPRRQRARFWREFFHDFMGSWPEEHWALGGRRFNPWHQGLDDFNPFVASLMSKGGGLLPLYVMQMLAARPLYGNEIMEGLTRRTGGRWIANPGAIYPLMTVLEQQGLIAGEWEDPTKRTIRIYRLTESGEQEMARLKAIVRPKLEEAIEVLKELARDLNGDESDPPEEFL